MLDKNKQESAVKTGDLIFVRGAGSDSQMRSVGIAVWFRDPLYSSHLFFAEWDKKYVKMASYVGMPEHRVVVRPDVFFAQVVSKMMENTKTFNTSLNWVVDGLNQRALEIGPNHTPDSLFEVLVKGLGWKVVA